MNQKNNTNTTKIEIFFQKCPRLLAFLVLFLATLITSHAQTQIKVSGLVQDKLTGEVLEGAAIINMGASPIRGTVSDEDGRFVIEVQAEDTIMVSYLGYLDTLLTNFKAGDYFLIKLEDAGETMPTVVVPAATPVAFSSTAPLMRIPRRHLERDNEVAITSSLNRIPGVYMQTGALNTNRITIRGIGNRSLFSTAKIRAYLDDIPLTSGIGETTIEDIDLSLIEEVDVWKGPTASTYGAGLGGMIHLKSKATEWDGIGTNFSQSNLLGSYGLFRNVSNLQYVNGNNSVALNLNYNNTHSDGYRENNEYDREGLTFLGRIRTSDNNLLTLLANYTYLKAFIPSSLDREDYLTEPTKAAFTWGRVMGFEDSDKGLFGISNQHQFVNSDFENTTSFFTSYRNAYELRPFNILDESSLATGGRTRFSYKPQIRALSSLDAGVEFFREQYKWKTFDTDVRDSLLSDNSETRNYINIFLEGKIKLFDPNLRLTAGLNVNATHYNYEDLFLANGDNSGEYTFESIFSPRIGLSYLFTPQIILFATVSHGFSPPTLEETLTPDGTINPDIQPEKGWNFEIGSRGRYLNQRLKYDVALYTMRIRDLLVARRTAADQFIGINAGKTTHTGLEAFLQYRLVETSNSLDIYFTYHYSDYKFDEFIDGDDNFSGNELTGQPPHVISAGLDFAPRRQGFYGNINFQYTDAFPMRDDNSVFSESYSLVNLKLGYKFKFGSHWELDLNAGINNILDEEYASMILINAGSFGGNDPRYYYPGLPRNYYGGLLVRYLFQ